MSESTFGVFVDRIEGDKAVLLIGEERHELNLPKSLLPAEAVEGAWLTVRIDFDAEATLDAGERIARLLENLGG